MGWALASQQSECREDNRPKSMAQTGLLAQRELPVGIVASQGLLVKRFSLFIHFLTMIVCKQQEAPRRTSSHESP